MTRRRRASLLAAAAATVLGLCGLGGGAAYHVGTLVSAPAPAAVGAAPGDLPAEAVTFPSPSGSRLSGWLVAGTPRVGAVLLLHGIHANRLQMLERARFLHRRGFTVLLFDFQAHGESPGRSITFGYLEALDARAAFDFLRRKAPAERIGVVGVSLGGAAAILAGLPADAMVLEAVYADFGKAVQNRLALWLGATGRYLEPLLTWQVRPRLGFDPGALRPAERIGELGMPVLLVAGDADRHATLDEAKLLYARARQPKELWVIPGAGHVDFHGHAQEVYERRIGAFFTRQLAGGPS